MTKVKIVESESKDGLNRDRFQAVNPYDAIVATLDGDMIVERHVDVWTTTRREGTASHKPGHKKVA